MAIKDRLVQIWVGDKPEAVEGRLGSGLLLNDGVIVTARHVLGPLDKPLSADLTIKVRIGFEDGGRVGFASLHWPEPGPPREDALDVALLKFDDGGRPYEADSMPIIGMEDEPDGLEMARPLKVGALGFPAFANSAKKDRLREVEDLQGTASFYAGLSHNEIRISELNLDGKKRNDELWEGFSGAPIVAQKHLIGVIASVARGQTFEFRGVRIDPLLKDPTFVKAMSGAAQLGTQAATRDVPNPASLIWGVDREDQSGEFLNACDRRPRALICIVPCTDTRHLPEQIPAKFYFKTMPDWLQRPEAKGFAPNIAWPNPRHSPATALQLLQKTLWNLLSQTQQAPQDPESYRAIFRDVSQPRFFISDLQGEQFELNSELGNIISQWCCFLSAAAPQVPSGEAQPIVHVFLVNASLQSAMLWKTEAISAPGIVIDDSTPEPEALVAELTAPRKCLRTDIDTWFEKHLKPRYTTHGPLLDDMQIKLTDEFDSFYVKELRSAVQRYTHEANHG